MNISNRAVFYMTFLVLAAMAALFIINFKGILGGQVISQTYLKPNFVRGMAVKHKQLIYTLNFQQQNQIVDILNQSVKTQQVKPGKQQVPEIEQIIIYQFDGKPDLIITPLAYVDNELIYTNPAWNSNGYMMEVSNGQLQKLLSQTYDP